MKRTAWPAARSSRVQGGVTQPDFPEAGGADCGVSRSFNFGHQVMLAVSTRKGSEVSGTGSVAAADAPLIGSAEGSVLEAATVEGSDQRIRRPE
jgi:hypothetical protein